MTAGHIVAAPRDIGNESPSTFLRPPTSSEAVADHPTL
jgi:hypothetical protein